MNDLIINGIAERDLNRTTEDGKSSSVHFIHFPFDKNLTCGEQGETIIETIATYHEPGPEQGWYTKKGDLVFGFYCE